jgi:hypothetical protein
LSFTIPTRPDGTYAVTAQTAAGATIAATSFQTTAYSCFWETGTAWTWDAVGWDAYSPMTYYVNGSTRDSWSAFSNGSVSARTFAYICWAGTTVSWQVTGMYHGTLQHAGGTFVCS